MNGTSIIKEIMMILKTYYYTQLLYTINLLNYLNTIFLTILYIILTIFAYVLSTYKKKVLELKDMFSIFIFIFIVHISLMLIFDCFYRDIFKEIMMILRTYYCTQLLYTINFLNYLNTIFLIILYIILIIFASVLSIKKRSTLS